MKGTIQEIVGNQESGITKIGREWFIENWSSNFMTYSCDLRTKRNIKNVLQYLVNSGAVEVVDSLDDQDDDYDYYEEYKGRYYRPLYREEANSVSMEELDVEGTRYVIGDMIVIVPDGWN